MTFSVTQRQHDTLHQGITGALESCTHHSMFVDDKISVAFRSRLRETICTAVRSAYDFFGHPAATRQDHCLKADKFPTVAGPIISHLGYIYDTRKLRITWPNDEIAFLHDLLDSWLTSRRA
jgi:hypothetical protein